MVNSGRLSSPATDRNWLETTPKVCGPACLSTSPVMAAPHLPPPMWRSLARIVSDGTYRPNDLSRLGYGREEEVLRGVAQSALIGVRNCQVLLVDHRQDRAQDQVHLAAR